MAQSFDVSTKQQNGIGIMKITGDITSEAEERMNKAFDSLVSADQKTLVLDLAEADYVNSAGIAIIIGFLNQINNLQGTIKMAGLNKHFRKVIETVGLNDFIPLHETVEEALQ